MPNVALYLQKIKTTPPKILIKRVATKFKKVTSQQSRALKDQWCDTRENTPVNGEPHLLLNANELDLHGIDVKMAQDLVGKWMDHRFDLLGSGWVRCGFYDNAPGIEGYRYAAPVRELGDVSLPRNFLAKQNISYSERIWRLIDNPNYSAIDWQKDFKSGYRWNSADWYLKQKWANKPGGDIKVPWELSRLQHLPRLAIFSMLFPSKQTAIYEEFRNQCLDFFAQNPPRMGVNWMCTMDVGIRTANLVLAYSLFASQQIEIDEGFRQIFLNSIKEHCNHIYHNLEWSEILTSNHYLSDIAGLLFGAAFLPENEQQREWYDFSSKEVKNEIKKQFYDDGTNFEGSTAYHRLSADLSAYCTALMMGIEGEKAEEEISKRLYGAGEFIRAITRPDGMFTQIGDNDSGFLFRLSPTGEIIDTDTAKKKYSSLEQYNEEKFQEVYVDEAMNDGRTTVSAISGFYDNAFIEEKELYPLEKSLVMSLTGNRIIEKKWSQGELDFSKAEAEKLEHYDWFTLTSSRGDLKEGLCGKAFPYFGIYVFCSQELYMVVNGTDNGQNGNAGHCHNDKLSIEVFLNGKPMMQDVGSYVYTCLPELRNSYRNTAAHFTIQTGFEQNDTYNLFSMKNETSCRVIAMKEDFIDLEVRYKHVIHRRKIQIFSNEIKVEDFCNLPFTYHTGNPPMSMGYGKRLRND